MAKKDKSHFYSIFKNSLELFCYAFFPRRCELCGEVVALNSKKCDYCSKLKIITGDLCKKCGCQKDVCICKSNDRKPEYNEIIAPYYFCDVYRGVHRFKLYGFKELTPAMANDMAKSFNKYYSDVDFDYITYVPLTKKRKRKRGYNQSKLLADELSKQLGLPVVNALKKIFDTNNQRGSSAKQRRINLHGAFDLNVDVENTIGKTILLVDDVKTTGSTLSECALVLKGYGAKAVYAITFSVVKRENNND